MQNSSQFFVPKFVIPTIYKPLPLMSCEAEEKKYSKLSIKNMYNSFPYTEQKGGQEELYRGETLKKQESQPGDEC